MRTRKMTISTTVTEDEIKDRLLREHLLDIGAIPDLDAAIPSEIKCRITRGRNKAGGYLIETWQDRLPSRSIPLLPGADMP